MHNKKNSTLKSGWRNVMFGDFVRQSKEKADPESSGLKRYIAGDHMDTDDLRLRRWGEIGSGYLGPAFHMRFKPGQVLYGSRRTYLRKVAVANFEGICANTTFILESKDRNALLPDFLPFLMQTDEFNDYSVKNSKGSVNPYINFTDLAEFSFSLPPVEIQRKFIQFMRTFDDLIEGYSIASSNGKRLLNSLREDVFSFRSNGHQLSELVLDIQAGKSLLGKNQVPCCSTEKAVLKVSAIGEDGFMPKEVKVLLEQEQFLDVHSVRDQDVLITRANTPDLVGMVCLVEGNYSNLMLCDKTLRLVPRPDVDSLLLSECLKTVASRQYIRSNATGTGGAMKNISQGKLRAMPVQYPLESERENAKQILSDAIDSYRSVMARLMNIKRMRRHALAKLVAAEV